MEDSLAEFEKRISKGFQFADMLGFINQKGLKENQILLHSLLELMISKGIIRLHELEERKSEITKYFEEKGQNSAKIHLVETADKYQFKSDVQIDCENRIHLCKASCCKLWFALSKQDLDEGIVKWNYYRPYEIARHEDGYCSHLDKSNKCSCKIYHNRPLVCRSYDCREDKRIWLDFEKRIPNPELEQEGWPNTN